MVEVQNSLKNARFYDARPSAGIGVVEVQKLKVFYDFCGSHAVFCADRRGRGSKTQGFYDFCGSRTALCGDRRGRGAVPTLADQ